MTVEEIKTNLCCYNKQNPDCIMDDEDIADHKKATANKNVGCFCDNCFYGRTKLANELLKFVK